jgi:transcriptional regulator with XRE-family HTH domain
MSAWKQIERLMDSKGLNKIKLAGICGVQPSAVTKWARGGKIGSQYLGKIALHCGVSVDWLLSSDTVVPNDSDNKRALPSAAYTARYNFEFALRSMGSHPYEDRAVHWFGSMMLMLSTGIDDKGNPAMEAEVNRIVAKIFRSARGEKIE